MQLILISRARVTYCWFIYDRFIFSLGCSILCRLFISAFTFGSYVMMPIIYSTLIKTCFITLFDTVLSPISNIFRFFITYFSFTRGEKSWQICILDQFRATDLTWLQVVVHPVRLSALPPQNSASGLVLLAQAFVHHHTAVDAVVLWSLTNNNFYTEASVSRRRKKWDWSLHNAQIKICLITELSEDRGNSWKHLFKWGVKDSRQT